MKKNTKRFISSVVALSMAFSSAVTTSVAVSADDTATAAVDETVSAGAVTVEKSTLMAEDVDLLAVSKLDAGETATFGDVAMKAVVNLTEVEANATVDETSYTSAIRSNGENNVHVGTSTGRAMAEFTSTKDVELALVVKLSKGKTGWLIESDTPQNISSIKVSGNEGWIDFDEPSGEEYKLAEGTVSNKFTIKANKYYYLVGGGTDLQLFDVIVSASGSSSATESTTEVATVAETSTEATTKAEVTTEATTKSEETTKQTSGDDSSHGVGSLKAGETAVYGDVTMKAVVDLTENKLEAAVTVDGVDYTSGVKSGGQNNVKVGSSTGRAMAEFTSPKDTDITLVVKLNDGKSGWLVESDVPQTISAVKITEGFVAFDEANTQALTAGGTFANKLSLKAGKYYYLVGGGTDLVLFDVIVSSAGSTEETTEATTVAESTTTAEPTSQATTTAESTTTAEPTTQATTTAESTTTAEPTTQATTTATEASSETTTAKSSGGSGSGSARVKESDFKVEDTASGTTFTSGTVTLTAAQNLKASGESLSGEGTNAKLNGETDANLWGVVASTVDTTVSLHLELAKGTIGYVIESESGDPATANLSTENAVWKVDTTGDTPQLMAAGDFDDYAVFDVKAGKYYYIVAEGSSGFAVSAFAEAEDIVEGEGAFKAADVKVKPGGTVDVVYKYEGTAFNNFTGFFKYDPSIGKLKDIKVEAKGATDTYTGSFSNLCEQEVSADTDIAGYKEVAGERLSALGNSESKTEAEIGVVKVGTYFTVDEKNIDTSDVTITLTFEANADAAEGADVKLAYVVYADARNTYNNIVDVSFDEVQITATASAGGVEDNQEVGEGTFTASDVEVKPGKTVDVVYNYDGAAFNNFTGFFKYDPSIGKLTGIKIEAKGDNGTYTGDFSELCTKAITADTDIKGYETEAAALAEGESKTEAELGKVKVGTYFTVDGKNIDTSDVTITLTFEANADAAEGATTTISYEEYAKARNTDNNIIKVSYGDAKITATENAVAQGAYSLSIPTEGVTKNADGTYTIGEDVTKFKVVVASDADFDITNFTVGLGFDPAYVKAVSGTGSDLVSDSVVSKAVAYTPTAANPDYAGKGADGVKTAGELGYIKLSNTTLFNADAAADAALAIDKEFLELKKGQTIAEFEFETVASTTTPTKITLTNIESTVLVGDPMVDPDFKYVVDEDKAWDISLNVAVKEPVTPPTPTTETVYYHLLGDVDHDNKIQAQDASIVYDYTLDDDKVEHAIDKNIAAVSDDVSVKDDGTVVLYAKDASAVYQKSLDDDYLYARTKDTYTEPNNANRSYAKVDVTGISEADVKTWTEKGTLVSVEVEKASETPAVQ